MTRSPENKPTLPSRRRNTAKKIHELAATGFESKRGHQLFGRLIEDKRTRIWLSRKDVAETLGKSISWVMMLELGLIPTNEVTPEILENLANLLKVEVLSLELLLNLAKQDESSN